MYPAANIEISCKSIPVREGIYRKSTIAYNSQGITTYMQQKYKWTTRIMENIWWRVHGMALQSLKPSARQIIQKFIFDYWACNEREAKIYTFRTPQCETCVHKIETVNHILQCIDPKRRSIWKEMLDKLKEFFKKWKTPQGVQTCIIAGLESWGLRQQPPDLETIYPNASHILTKAYKEQNTIGWDHFIRGRLTSLWGRFINHDIHAQYQQNMPINNNYRSAEAWGKKLVVIIWTHVTKIWEIRNKGAQQEYSLKDLKRDKEFIKQKAYNLMNKLQQYGEIDRDWITRDVEEIEKMHQNRLEVWVNNMEKIKKLINKK